MMRGKAIRSVGAALAACFFFAGCASAPCTFVQTLEPTWSSVKIRPEVPYDAAWACLVDALVKRFDVEVMSKEDGYVRTGWMYSWTGKVLEDYRVRVTAKFSPDRTKVEIKSEAEYGGANNWVIGYDTRLLETLKADIVSAMGRVSK
jgi:ribosomal protein S17E